jgi:hypothetical protein
LASSSTRTRSETRCLLPCKPPSTCRLTPGITKWALLPVLGVHSLVFLVPCPSIYRPGVNQQQTCFAVPEQRRSGDSGRPVPDDRWHGWRRRRALASPPAAAAEAAARLGQLDMAGDAACLPAVTEHRDRYGSCSIITIPTLRYDATSPDLERVPLPGQTHLT